MGKQSRQRAAAPEIMLQRQDVPAVAVLSLMDALLIDMERAAVSTPYRANIIASMKGKVVKLHDTYQGRVTDDMVTLCDRYLCRVQDALDTFFDDITEEDLGEIARVHGKWPQKEAA